MDELEARLHDRFDLEQINDVESIEPAERCMANLGDPQQDFYSFHVAGTNGKGSTCTFLARSLEAAGFDVGLYIHPHLRVYRERFRINGEMIAEDRLLEIAEQVAEAGEPSSYEFSTGIAFEWFSQEDVDVAVIETGMGGRLDATNTMEADVDIITTIGMDHSEVLGDTREEIAGEKAAIIDPGAEVVSHVSEDVDHVIRQYADDRGARYHRAGDHVSLTGEGLFLDAVYRGETVPTQIVAPYQEANINTAITALSVSDLDVGDEAIRMALERFKLQARMQQLAEDPLTLADGAHNPDGMAVACDAIDRLDTDVTAVFGVMEDKEYSAMLDRLEDSIDTLILTEPSKDRAAEPGAIQEYTSMDAEVVSDPGEAVATAQAMVDDGVVFVTGSLYLIGDLLEEA